MLLKQIPALLSALSLQVALARFRRWSTLPRTKPVASKRPRQELLDQKLLPAFKNGRKLRDYQVGLVVSDSCLAVPWHRGQGWVGTTGMVIHAGICISCLPRLRHLQDPCLVCVGHPGLSIQQPASGRARAQFLHGSCCGGLYCGFLVHDSCFGVLCCGFLVPLQEESLHWMVNNYRGQIVSGRWKPRNCILGDEMGLGKTAQSIAVISWLKQFAGAAAPCMVVAPLTTLGHWKREIETWTDLVSNTKPAKTWLGSLHL